MIAQLKALTCRPFGHKIAFMTEAEHEKKIQDIKNETEDIKRQIMQLEFLHKKDIVGADRGFEGWSKAMEAKKDSSQKQIDHRIKLVGLTYDELDQIDATLNETGVVLLRPRKRVRVQ